jgi:hypothetical protein
MCIYIKINLPAHWGQLISYRPAPYTPCGEAPVIGFINHKIHSPDPGYVSIISYESGDSDCSLSSCEDIGGLFSRKKSKAKWDKRMSKKKYKGMTKRQIRAEKKRKRKNAITNCLLLKR